MAKKKLLAPMMFPEEFNAVVASSKPMSRISIWFDSVDIEQAVEFWLNNVVLKHPVTVVAIKHNRDGSCNVMVDPAAA